MTETTNAPKSEARERFERVILPRVDKAVKAVELIGNGAAREYETTPEEIASLLGQLRTAMREVEVRYTRRFGPTAIAWDDAPAEPPPSAPAAKLALAPEGERLLQAVRGLNWHHVPLVAAELDADLVAPLTTRLVARLNDMANGKVGEGAA